MKYISEINTFYDWLELNELSTSAVALWYALMHINNKAAWIETFTVAESVLSIKTGLSGRGVRNARNELKQKGRIDFRSRAGGRAPVYTIISFETGINCLNESLTSKRVPASDGAEEVSKEMSSEEIIPTETHSAVYAGGTSVGCAGDTSAVRATLIDIDKEIEIEIDNITTITKDIEPWEIALKYFCKKSKRAYTQLKLKEFEAAKNVCKEIPLKIVLEGISQAFSNYNPGNGNDKINSFKYCEPIIIKLYARMKIEKDSSKGRKTEFEDIKNQNEYMNISNNVENSDIFFEKSDEDISQTNDSIKYIDIVNLYHSICKSYPKVDEITEKMKDVMDGRLKTFKDIKVFKKLFTKAESSDFLSGRNGKWSGCSFDWLLNEDNMVKVLKGNYDNNRKETEYKKTFFNNYEQRQYDYDDLEKKLLARSEKDAAEVELDPESIMKQNKILGRNG